MKEKIRELRAAAVVAGSGAAGFNAVHRLWQYGVKDAVLVTEGRNSGTSRNAGSDKQTYYKLSLSGSGNDSVRKLAKVLYDGGCVDGDHALCEAALSAQGFFKLLELGVPFPHSSFGEFVGYKTDHDPNDRGTSAGPYTSRYMTEVLERAVEQAGIAVYDHFQIIRILTGKDGLLGILCLDKEQGGYVVIWCRNLIYATGGPAGIYADRVYPASQFGASGLAFEAGVLGKNLTEWQYGLASLCPRWNVSGSYMQVLPRVVSTDQNGNDEREFLLEHFKSREEMLDMLFLKGYQWPFDASRADGGSSVIDLLVYRETQVRGRRVWLDFRSNSEGMPIQWEKLSEETVQYLEKAGACQDTPYERLQALNPAAVSFYWEHGVNLETEMLEIAVCAQHSNGGLSVDAWWQTDIPGIFAVGEVAGTHGIRRPGGSALNAGQAGGTRAAECIAARLRREAKKQQEEDGGCGERGQGEAAAGHLLLQETKDAENLLWQAQETERPEGMKQIWERISLGEMLLQNLEDKDALQRFLTNWDKAARKMSENGAMLRDVSRIKEMSREAEEELRSLNQAAVGWSSSDKQDEGAEGKAPSSWDKEKCCLLSKIYRYYDMRICQKVYLDAMADYFDHGGRSRGSAVYREENGHTDIPDLVSFSMDGPEGMAHSQLVQEIGYDRELVSCQCQWRPVRKLEDIPEEKSFEKVWKQFIEENQ